MPTKTRVEVDFRGLCMFVPGTNADGNSVLHVLMPKTGHDMGGMRGMPAKPGVPGMPGMPGMAARPIQPDTYAARVHTKRGKGAKAGDAPSLATAGMTGMTSANATGETTRAIGEDGSMPMPTDPVMQHVPRVVYSLDYEASDSPSMPVAGGFVTAVERVIDLIDGTVIDWSKLGIKTTATAVTLPPEIVSVTGLAEEDLGEGNSGATVKAALLVGTTLPPAEQCAARITLPGTVTILPYNVRQLKFAPAGAGQTTGGEGATSSAPDSESDDSKPRDVAACTLCVFETDAQTLDLPVPGAHNLVESGGVIRVMFGNTIPGDYQHPPLFFDPKGQTHFGAFYGLLNQPPTAPRVPEAPSPGFSPGSTSCMTSGGKPGGH